jgi:glycosyltransferase involved in cell wall biosynthesis
MNILFISLMEGFPWGGSEELWNKVASYALERKDGVICSVKKWHTISDKILFLKNNGATIVERENKILKSGYYNKIKRRLKNFFFNSSKPDIWYELSKYDIDNICINFGGCYDILYFPSLISFVQKTAKPYSIIVQLNHENFPLSNDERNTVRVFFQKAHSIFFVSERNKIVSERNLAIHIKNGFVVDNPIKIEQKGIIDFATTEVWHLACVARFDCKYKNQDILLQIISSPYWKEQSLHLNLYGEGSDEEYLRELITLYDLNSKVTIHGHIKDIRAVWVKNHILILPSFAEGTPLSLIEAVFCGRTAVVTDVGGNAALIDDEINGFLADCYQLQSFEKTLKKAWERREYWKEMGEKAFAKATTKIKTDSHKVIYNNLSRDERHINSDLLL